MQDLLTPGSDIRLLWLGNLSWMMRLGGRLWAVDLDLETDVRVHNVTETDSANRLWDSSM